MPVRLFLGYFVALAACATCAFASLGIDGSETPNSLAADQTSAVLLTPGSPLHTRLHKSTSSHVQLAQAQ